MQLLRNEAMANLGDLRAAFGILGLKANITFAIDRGRAIVEVGGTDAEKAIIDDDELCMNLHLDARSPVANCWIINTQPAPAIGCGQAAQKTITIVAHRELLDIAR